MKHFLLTLFVTVLIAGKLQAQLNLQWQEIGPDNIGGMIFGLVLDKRDITRQTLYAGADGGGVWKSTNGGNSWYYLGCAGNYAVSCMTQASDGTIYFGTGSPYGFQGSSFSTGHMGNGIYKLDVGDNIIHLSATTANNTGSPWASVGRIAVQPGNTNQLLAATHKGLYRSLDAGVTWDSVIISGISLGQSAIDVKWTTDSLKVFAAVGGQNKLVRSLDGGNTWTRISNTTSPGFPGTQGRIEIAIAPSNSNVIYTSIATTYGTTYGVWKSVDAGNTWDTVSRKSPSFDPFGPNGQGWFDNAIAVQPGNPGVIFVGGVNMYSISPQTGTNKLTPFNAPDMDSTETLEQFLFVMNDLNPDIMYAATTRGVFKSVNVVTSFLKPAFYSSNSGLAARNFYSIGAARNGTVMGGSEDYGTGISHCGSKSFSRLNKDITFCEFSHLDTNFMFTSQYSGRLHISTTAGYVFYSYFDTMIDPQRDGTPSRCGGGFNSNASFISPFQLHETKTAWNSNEYIKFTSPHVYTSGDTVHIKSKTARTPFVYTLPVSLTAGDTLNIPDPVKSRLFLSSACGVWMKNHALDAANRPDWYRIAQPSGYPQCYALSPDGNTLYCGTSTGGIYGIEGLNRATYGSNWNMKDSFTIIFNTGVSNSRGIEGISVSPDGTTILAAVAGYSTTDANVLYSLNAGFSWSRAYLGTPNNPAYTCVIDINNPNNFMVGTEHGVWSSTDGGANWQQDFSGMCDVPVYRLRQIPFLNDDCPVIYAATNSRGLWRSFSLTPQGCNLNACTYPTNIEPVFSNNQRLKIFPNPASTQLNIELEPEHPQPVNLFITDMAGRIILTDEKFAASGKQIIQVDISSLAPGTYVVSAFLNSIRYSALLVKSE